MPSASKIKINFDPALFLPLFRKLNKVDTRYCIIYGGSGSGKSYTLTQWLIIEALKHTKRIMVLRKTAASLTETSVEQFDEILRGWGIRDEEFVYNKVERKYTNKRNGSEIFFKGLDDVSKLKSLSGVDYVFMEEADECEEADFLEITRRIRGGDGKQRIFIVFNPVSDQSWLKKLFFDGDHYTDRLSVFKCTYKDNHHLNDEDIRNLQLLKEIDYEQYKVYALGDWGKAEYGGEFYKKFNVQRHTDNLSRVYNPERALHISFDENVRPFLACSIWQVVGKKAMMIDEIALPDPNNTLKDTCTEIAKRFKSHNAQMYIYGDASSRKEDTKLEKGQNFFTLITDYLKDFHPELRVPRSNPSVAMRGMFINEVLAVGYDGIQIVINNENRNAIADFENVKEDVDGTKLKKKITDKKSGTRYEQWGHFTDCSEYFLCRIFNESYQRFQNKGSDPSKWVMSRRKDFGRY